MRFSYYSIFPSNPRGLNDLFYSSNNFKNTFSENRNKFEKAFYQIFSNRLLTKSGNKSNLQNFSRNQSNGSCNAF